LGVEAKAKSSHRPLSKRQLEILKLFMQGRKRKEIASDLSIDIRTVKAHFARLFDYFDCDSYGMCAQVQLAVAAYYAGYCPCKPCANGTPHGYIPRHDRKGCTISPSLHELTADLRGWTPSATRHRRTA